MKNYNHKILAPRDIRTGKIEPQISLILIYPLCTYRPCSVNYVRLSGVKLPEWGVVIELPPDYRGSNETYISHVCNLLLCVSRTVAKSFPMFPLLLLAANRNGCCRTPSPIHCFDVPEWEGMKSHSETQTMFRSPFKQVWKVKGASYKESALIAVLHASATGIQRMLVQGGLSGIR
jgi:hypothetical protein